MERDAVVQAVAQLRALKASAPTASEGNAEVEEAIAALSCLFTAETAPPPGWLAAAAQLEVLVHHLPIAVLFESESGAVLQANPAFFVTFRLSPSASAAPGALAINLIATAAQSVSRPADFVNRFKQLTLANRRSAPEELLMADGRTLEQLFVPVTEHGSAHLWLFRDITAQKQMERTKSRLMENLLFAQDDERRRLARELHDGLGQTLTSLTVGLRFAEELRAPQDLYRQLRRLRTVAESALEDLSRISRGLHPAALDDLGLCAALERLAEEAADVHHLQVDVQVHGLDDPPPLPRTLTTALYRIAQECLNNVAKHANGTWVGVVVSRGPERLRMVIEDNGAGFDMKSTQDGSTGLGFTSMRERAALFFGTVTIQSAPQQGTALIVDIPLPIRTEVRRP